MRGPLRAMLLRRGLKPDTADDVVQETAVRLWKSWSNLDTDKPLWPLVRRIALNCLADRYRNPDEPPIGEVPEEADAYDITEHAFARVRLAALLEALHSLRPRDRSVLLAEIGIGDRAPTGSASKMARLRARTRLSDALDRIGGAVCGIWIGWRRYVQPEAMAGMANASAAAVVALAVSITVASLPSPDEGFSRRLKPRTVIEAASMSRQSRGKPSNLSPARVTAAGQTNSEPQTNWERPRTPQPPPKEKSNDTIGEAGGAQAKHGEGKGYTYIAVCTGQGTEPKEDDHTIIIVVNDGSQDPNDDDDEPENCEEEEEEEAP